MARTYTDKHIAAIVAVGVICFFVMLMAGEYRYRAGELYGRSQAQGADLKVVTNLYGFCITVPKEDRDMDCDTLETAFLAVAEDQQRRNDYTKTK